MEPIGKAKAMVASTDAVLSAPRTCLTMKMRPPMGQANGPKLMNSVSSLKSPAQYKPKGYSWLWKNADRLDAVTIHELGTCYGQRS